MADENKTPDETEVKQPEDTKESKTEKGEDAPQWAKELMTNIQNFMKQTPKTEAAVKVPVPEAPEPEDEEEDEEPEEKPAEKKSGFWSRFW